MSKGCYIIANPTSGSYSRDKLDRAREMLVCSGMTTEILLTRSAADAPAFAREACLSDERPLVVAAGGDGTVNAVLNGMIPGKGDLAVLPLGTSNVLSLELGIRNLDDAVERIIRGETRGIAVGEIASGTTRRYFLLMAGIGFDGRVVQQVRLREKRFLHQGAYLLSALRALRDWDNTKIHIVADGREVKCTSAIVCRASRYGGKFILVSGASLFDPALSVVCIEGGRRELLAMVSRVLRGRGVEGPGVVMLSGEEVSIHGEKPVQVDGDFFGMSPLSVRSVRGFTRLIV